MAPFTPFLTETMYQQLRKKCPQFSGPNFASVHYLMLPQAKENLIYEDVERAVARMQSVVDLGRVLRDRKTMPIKYPLPEVVVIHKDQQCLDDIRSLERYILEELNVRSVTLSSDKASYGVTLRAEPDHKTLGFRLKGDFKPVMAEIKTLSDAVLTGFLEGEKLAIKGHDISTEDIRIMYSFTGEKSKELSEKYEADSQEDVLVLLDTTPDQEMLDEGVAREVVNRVQKLRKSAGLKVDDQVTMLYTVSPASHHLASVIKKFSDYIQTSSKTPLQLLTSQPKDFIKKESYDLKGAKLELVVSPGDSAAPAPGSSSGPDSAPASDWINLVLLGSAPSSYVGSHLAGLLLPSAQSVDLAALTELAQDIFGLYNVKLELFTSSDRKEKLSSVKAGSTVFVSRWNDQQGSSASVGGGLFNCNFVDVNVGGKTQSVLLENPRGKSLNVSDAFKNLTKGKNVKLFADSNKKKEVPVESLKKFVGQTLYL
jgi:isoleucyl-tRNA synthetase